MNFVRRSFASTVGAALSGMALAICWVPEAAASPYDCAGSNTDVCDPAGTDVCWPNPLGLWECFTGIAGESGDASTSTVYDPTGAVSGVLDSYATYGVDSLGNDFCCSYAASGITEIFVHTGAFADTISLRDTTLGMELTPGSLMTLSVRTGGGPGDDSLYGSNYVMGGPFVYSEVLSGNDGDDYLAGNNGNDVLQCGVGSDTAFGGGGNDNIVGDFGFDELHGGLGNDTISGNADADTINGDDNNDAIDGTAAGDFLSGDNGNDTVLGGPGIDTMCGDTLTGGPYADMLDGGGANDVIWGNDAFDAGTGGAGVNDCSTGSPALLLCTFTFALRPILCP